jgi:hypothetical protein
MRNQEPGWMRQRTHPDLMVDTSCDSTAPGLLLDSGCEPRVSSRRGADEENRSIAGAGRYRRQDVVDNKIAVSIQRYAGFGGIGSGGRSRRPAEEGREDTLPAVGSNAIAATEKQAAATNADASIGEHIRVEIIHPPDLTGGRNTSDYVWAGGYGCPGDDHVRNRIDSDGLTESNEQVFPMAGLRQGNDGRDRKGREQSGNDEKGSFAAPELLTVIVVHCISPVFFIYFEGPRAYVI